jgi:hypothetical protein
LVKQDLSMKSDGRKAAIAAYKERKIVAGIYAVRCIASGEVWVGQAPNLDKVQNRIWFMAGLGGHPCRGLQESWSNHGAKNFTFEVLERMKDGEMPYTRDANLKERLLHWRSALGAQAL